MAVLHGVRRFVIEYLQNIQKILANVQRHGAMISGKESYWCRNRVKKLGFVWGEAEMWLPVSKVNKM